MSILSSSRVPANWTSPFDMLDRELGRLMRGWQQPEGGRDEGLGVYPVDIREDENNIYIDAELPGFTRDQINVTLEKGVLTITAERGHEQTDAQTHLHERRATRVSRSFSMPETVDENDVQAQLENGVLRLTLKKRDEVKPRRIEVK